MKKGEVWRIRFPFVRGRTQAGERPAVIVDNEPSLSSLPVVLVVPFTSQLAAARFAATLLVQPDGINGLAVPSVALVFQLGAQDKRNFLDRLGELDAPTMDAILVIVRRLTLVNHPDEHDRRSPRPRERIRAMPGG
jgi:mRNA interferase MazF